MSFSFILPSLDGVPSRVSRFLHPRRSRDVDSSMKKIDNLR